MFSEEALYTVRFQNVLQLSKISPKTMTLIFEIWFSNLSKLSNPQKIVLTKSTDVEDCFLSNFYAFLDHI